MSLNKNVSTHKKGNSLYTAKQPLHLLLSTKHHIKRESIVSSSIHNTDKCVNNKYTKLIEVT